MKLWNKLGVMMAGVLMMLGVVMVPAGAWADVPCPKGTIRGDKNMTATNIGQCNVEPNESGADGERDAMFYVSRIINVILGVLGVVAIAVIVLSGIQIATANGDSAKVKRGMQAIMYAVIGLVVALLAFAIVNFVLTNVFK